MSQIKVFNILHSALNQTIDDIRDSAEENNKQSGTYLYEDGGVVIPIGNMDDLEPIRVLADTRDRARIKEIDIMDGEVSVFVKSIRDEDKIIRIPDCTILKLASVSKMMTEEENKGIFYGVMIVTPKGQRINPFHPSIALMIFSKEIELPETFTLLMYPYPIKKTITRKDSDEYLDQIVEISGTIHRNKNLPVTTLSPRDTSTMDKERFLSNQNASIVFDEVSVGIKYSVTPVQLATLGIIIPYYGLIETERTESLQNSRNMYPIESGNIIQHTGSGRGATCTGDLNNAMFGSLHVLFNMNIDSVFFKRTMPIDAHNFVDACIRFSATSLESIIKDIIERKEKNEI